jgi:sugar lactone lactonase YvrE
MSQEIRCAAPTGDVTGEGAVWSAGEGRLYWVDINRFLIRAYDEATGAVRAWFFDEPVTALALTDAPGTLVAALGSRLILWAPESDARSYFGPRLETAPRSRFNDGRPDPQGRFWIGSMGNNVGPNGEGLPVEPGQGALYRCGPDGSREQVIDSVGIANTVCWSPDGGTFYFADTMRNVILAYDFAAETGRLTEPREFLQFHRGHPDGSAVDSAGFLWNARYGGGCLVRVAPDGRIDRVVEIPSKNVTTCTFGGPDLRTLYVTTARGDGDPEHRLAGSLFALRVETPGLPENVVRLSETARRATPYAS